MVITRSIHSPPSLCDCTFGSALLRAAISLKESDDRATSGKCFHNKTSGRQGRGNVNAMRACGEEQTMEHIIEACSLHRLKGGIATLHTVDQESRPGSRTWHLLNKINTGFILVLRS